MTIEAINAEVVIDDDGKLVPDAELLAAIRSEAAGHYRLLIEQNPRLERFRNGWMNRAYR